MKRIVLLLAFFTLSAAGVAQSAPAYTPAEITTTILMADTLARNNSASFATVDSARYLGPVNVFGARAIIVEASSSAPLDTLSVGELIFDVAGTGVYNTYSGGGILKFMQGVEVACGGVINAEGTQIYRLYATTQGAQGGTPAPVTTRSVYFKIKSGNKRAYNAASQATLAAPSGTITVRMHVIR